jgi:muconolactone delta-isomerase
MIGKALIMEYLVTMTTSVPDGTPDETVEQIRAREASRSRELAAQQHLLRLWRPPLRPGEWRTLGLFAAADGTRLEQVLASMPLRVWRTDEVIPLSPHPNDPALPPQPGAAEFLTTFTITIPPDTPGQAVTDAETREAPRAKELAEQGHLLRLWRLPEPGRALGLWQAGDLAGMQAIVASLPLDPWMTTDIVPLTPHPSDPASAGSRSLARRTSARTGPADEDVTSIDRFDITIDGADQIAPDGWLVKGGGGAHTREKIVAGAADRFVVIADSSKPVPALHAPVPLELLSFGLRATLRRVEVCEDFEYELRDTHRV